MFSDFKYIDKNFTTDKINGEVKNTFWFTMPIVMYKELDTISGDIYSVYEYVSFPLGNPDLDSFRFFRVSNPYFWNKDLSVGVEENES